jgi:hypothetical protein
MSSFEKCPICNQYGWIGRHRCLPQWRVADAAEGLDNGATVRGEDEGKAAIKFVSQFDQDCLSLSEETAIVVLKESDWEELCGAREELAHLAEELKRLQSQTEPLDEEDQEILDCISPRQAEVEAEIKRLEGMIKTLLVKGEMMPSYWIETPRVRKESGPNP